MKDFLITPKFEAKEFEIKTSDSENGYQHQIQIKPTPNMGLSASLVSLLAIVLSCQARRCDEHRHLVFLPEHLRSKRLVVHANEMRLGEGRGHGEQNQTCP